MKKITVVILCAVMLALCIPAVTVSAEDDNIFTVTTGVEFVDQWNSAAAVNGTVKLERDVNIANEYTLDANRSLTIDLNGHTINGVGTDADYIFNIVNGSSMTVTDSSEAQSGKIIATKVYEDYDEVIIVNEGGRLTLNSGTIQGNGDDDCRLIVVESGTFIMNGGSVTGNTYNGDGAGIYINEGGFTMNGGSVSNNRGDNSNDYGGAIYFDGSTDSRLFIRGGEIYGNSAFCGGAVYVNDGYAEFTGGKFYNNTSRQTSAIEIAATADSVKLAGDLLVTGNTSVNSNGNMTYAAAVNVSGDAFTGVDVYLGGSVKIYGNGLADFYTATSHNAVYIMNDMDTSPENHAWIGVISNPEFTPFNFDFEGAGSKDYTVCFFGNKMGEKYFETLSYSADAEPYKIGVLDQIGELEEVTLNESGIKNVGGNTLTKGTDYTLSYDSVMREYSITSSQPITLAEADSLFKNNIVNSLGTTTLVKTLTEESVFGTEYTYYYLNECRLKNISYYHYGTSYTMIKQSYITVKVFVEDLKFFKNCYVDKSGNISGLGALLTPSDFCKNHVALEDLEILFNTRGFIGTGTEILVRYDGSDCNYTAVISGDVNGDSVCDVLDAARCEQAANEHITLEGVYFTAGDLNADSVIDADDYSAIVNKALS